MTKADITQPTKMDLVKHPLHIESLDLEITSRCNLRCPYCYVGTGKYPMGDMSDETIEQVLDLIFKYGVPQPTTGTDANGKQVNVQATLISFYGGEPFLSFDRVKYFIIRSIERGMKLRFTALSNGTLGTQDNVNFLNYFNIWTQRSIDGCPEVQEKYRPNSIKRYEEVTKIFKDYNSSRRMTVQPEFAKDLLKSLEYFESQGFEKGCSPMPNYYIEWTDEQIEDFKKSLWDLGKHYLEKWKQGKAFYVYYLSREMVARFQGSNHFGCGGARGLHCVSWDGHMYMCHRFSKERYEYPQTPFYFGHIIDVLNGTAKGYGEEVYARAADYLKGRDAWNEECKTCIANGGCEKGCMHTNFKCTGDLKKQPKLYCEIRKEAARVVSWLDDQLRPLDREWWKQGNTLVPQARQCNQQNQNQGNQLLQCAQQQGQQTTGQNICKIGATRADGSTKYLCQEFSDGTCTEFWK
jgi:uncharacterized protein